MINKQSNTHIKLDFCQQDSPEISNANSLLEAALSYARLGWSVIPLQPGEKKPLLKSWRPYQKKLATEKQIKKWWSDNPSANIGVITGLVSMIVVLDADSDLARDHIKKMGCEVTPVVETAKGVHIYFKHIGKPVSNSVDRKLGLDIRGEGGLIVAPPSIHPTGAVYKWKLSPWKKELEVLPGWVENHQNKKANPKITLKGSSRDWIEKTLKGVAEGERNDTTARLAGHYIAKGWSDYDISSFLSMWNQRNRPPLPSGEVQRTIRSTRATHEKNSVSAAMFPNVMSGLAGDFAKLYSKHLEAPPHFFYMAYLTCLGSTLARFLDLKSEIKPQPRFYTILLGESANDRKSTVIHKVVNFFGKAVSGINETIKLISDIEFDVSWGVGSAEGLQRVLKNVSTLLLVFDEFKQFTSKCQINSSVLLPCVNTLFENNRYENATKKSILRLNSAYLSVLAASTIETYEQIWTPTFTAIGLPNRLFIVPGSAERKFAFPPEIPEIEKEKLIKQLQNAIENYTCRSIKINKKAQALFEEWYKDLPKSIHSKRLDTYALRLMSLLTFNEGERNITHEIVQKAIELCDWQFEVRTLHDPISADNNMAQMEEKIRRILRNGPRTKRELKQKTNYTRVGLWFFETALKNLKNAREIRKTKSNGRVVKWELIL